MDHMDPNANLKATREMIETIRKDMEDGKRVCTSDVDTLMELVDELDTWLSRGGFLPDAWVRK